METCVLPVRALSIGEHSFEWRVAREFFAAYSTSEIADADLCINATVTKRQQFMEVKLSLSGWAEVACDRCLDPVRLDISAETALYVRFDGQSSADDSDSDHDVFVLAPDESDLDLTHYLYETAHLALPVKRVHPEGHCNRLMMEQYAKYVINHDEADNDIDNE